MTYAKTIAATLLLASSTLFAVKTQYWITNTEEAFAKGTLINLVINNRGAMKLSRQTKSLLPEDQHFDAITAMAVASDGSIIFGTFPDNKIIQFKEGKLETLAELEDKTITTIYITTDNKILVATAGERGEILQVTKAGEAPRSIFTREGVDYIWSILQSGDKLLLATGPDAVIYQLRPDGTSAQVAKLDGENVLSMIAGKDGTVYAGTGENGLVYRIDSNSGKPFLLYDAAEAEITSLAMDKDGNLIAATGEEREAAPVPPKMETGKPEQVENHPNIPSKTPTAPKEGEGAELPGMIPRDQPAAPESVSTTQESAPNEPTIPNMPGIGSSNVAASETQGNAVYKISPAGFCTELYRGPVIIHSMAIDENAIILGTGDEGKVIEINPSAEENAILAHTDSAQVNHIARAKDGSILLGTSNAGQILSMSNGYASEGSYESEIHDAAGAATFGTTQLRGQLPEGTSLTVSVRSGNSADPEKGGWSDWSASEPVKEYLPTKTAAGRYFQYKLNFKTFDSTKSAELDEIIQSYQRPNIAPRVTSISVMPDNQTPANGTHAISWEATDDNGDSMEYTVYSRVVGKSAWVELAKDLSTVTYAWTSKDTVDGRYEIKVVASDAKDNQPGEGLTASRLSSPITVDNSPPVIGDIAVSPDGANTKVTLRAVDRAGSIEKLEYALDNAIHWQKRLPDDTIADSPEERFTVLLTGISKGPHTLSVRATDQQGNVSYENINVTGQ